MRMRERFRTVLVNPTWEQIVERDPLMAFSHYLSGRVHVLIDLSDEIQKDLDQGLTADFVDGGKVGHAEGLMWLWILGAYEVVRTICQAKICFSSNAHEQFMTLKKKLAVVRMPAAKMEKLGKKHPVSSNRSPADWDIQTRDLFIGDPLDQTTSARSLLVEFEHVFVSLTKEDVLARHEESYLKGQDDGAS